MSRMKEKHFNEPEERWATDVWGKKNPTKRLTDVPIYSICQLIPHIRKKLSCICRI